MKLGLVVLIDGERVETVGAVLDGVIRNNSGVLERIDQQPGRNRLAWPQRVVLVVEDGLEPDRAAGGVDLIVDQRQRAGGQHLFAVGRRRDHLWRRRGQRG